MGERGICTGRTEKTACMAGEQYDAGVPRFCLLIVCSPAFGKVHESRARGRVTRSQDDDFGLDPVFTAAGSIK